MELEISQHGPITVAYTVFSDFLAYKSGIYRKSAAAQPLVSIVLAAGRIRVLTSKLLFWETSET